MCARREDNSAYDKNLQGHYMGVAGEYAVAEEVKGFMDFIHRPRGDKHLAVYNMQGQGGKVMQNFRKDY